MPIDILDFLCGVGYGSVYTSHCLRGGVYLQIGADGRGNVRPHHRIVGNIPLLMCFGGDGNGYVNGNRYMRGTLPLTLCFGGQGELCISGGHKVISSQPTEQRLEFGSCSDVSTLTPLRVYCNDLRILVPTISNHLPELDGYHNAMPTPCPDGMVGDTLRFYPHDIGGEPPPTIWDNLQGVEFRVLMERPYNGNMVWLIADLWYKSRQVMYVRNGEGSTSPSRYILDRNAFNSLIAYLSNLMGMQLKQYGTPPINATCQPRKNTHHHTSISTDIPTIKKWGILYTHH
jgi:hypothetical protein